MPETTTASAEERAYYLVQAVVGAVVGGLTVWSVWRYQLDENDREKVRAKVRSLVARWDAMRERRAAQAQLTYEVFLVQEAMEDYDGRHDLRERLLVA